MHKLNRTESVHNQSREGLERVLQLLFICTGNICRSPTAERLALLLSGPIGIPNLEVSSAGLRAVIGHPIHRQSALMIRRLGGDPAGFAARQLTPRIASSADLILTMTVAQRDAVLEMAPQKLHRTFALAEAAHLIEAGVPNTLAELAALRPRVAKLSNIDIPDPIEKDFQAFEDVSLRIAQLVPTILALCYRASRREFE